MISALSMVLKSIRLKYQMLAPYYLQRPSMILFTDHRSTSCSDRNEWLISAIKQLNC